MGAEVAAYFRRPPAPRSRLNGRLPYHLSEEMAALFEGRSRLRVLDIGCGPAQNRPFFEARGHTYIGLDLATPQADVRADAIALPFAAATFDGVITIAALQYTWDPRRFLKEAYRVLRPGGTITGTTAFLEPWTFGGLVQLTPGGLATLLERTGFTIEYIWPGWDVGTAVNVAALRPAATVGRILGGAQRLTHCGWWAMMNLMRRATGRPPRDRLIQDLAFAGSVNFHAHKPSE